MLIALSIFLVYGRGLNCGFTLDDFSHINYAWQSVCGHPEAMLSKLFGSWTNGKEDGIIAYRPTTCMSFILDFAIWRAKAYGWHLSNLVFYFFACLFTALTAFELLLRTRMQRLEAAITASVSAIFMALYPGHPDSVVTIVGRVDSLPTAFYMAALYCYIRAQSNSNQGRQKFQSLSLLSFWLALGSKETAVTLPVILFSGELLGVFKEVSGSWKMRLKQATKDTAPYFLTLLVFAILRSIVLHGQMGGYGKIHLKTMFRQLLGFLDRATIWKILLPINEHFPLPNTYSNAMLLLYGLASVNILSQLRNKSLLALVTFLLLFSVANVLLTFQIWHIYPNLVGFRLFFLSSTAFSIILAIGLPIDRKALGPSLLNILAIAFLSFVWTKTTINNIYPFEQAGIQIAKLQTQLNSLAERRKESEARILIEKLPQDYCGAPMIGRAAFLKALLSPPVNQQDVTRAFAVAENATEKHLELDTLNETSADAKYIDRLQWDEKQTSLINRQ